MSLKLDSLVQIGSQFHSSVLFDVPNIFTPRIARKISTTMMKSALNILCPLNHDGIESNLMGQLLSLGGAV
jgi:hypothetical protein